MATVIGEDLERLFAAFECGRVSRSEFNARKKALLDWSGCRLSLRTPSRLRFRPTS
jgi:hypothetical protein